MKSRIKITLAIAAISIAILVTGCGYNPEDPVYDTQSNPEGFPQTALNVLDRLEDGTLTGLDSVANAFADLYITYPDLLDNAEWQAVVDRLGAKFKFLAERLRQADDFGIDDYSQLADYYTLASFARPGDTLLAAKADRFECWREIADAFPRLNNAVGRSTMTLENKIAVIRSLIFAGDNCRTFLRDLLVGKLFDSPPRINSLTATELALLDLAGLEIDPEFEPLAAFGGPRIDLVAFRVTPIDSAQYDVEMYFVPHDTVTEDYQIAFWIYTSEDQPEGAPIGEQRFPFDFQPLEPSSAWPPGRVAAARQAIEYGREMGSVAVGLYASKGSRLEFIKVLNTDDNLVALPIP